AEPRHVRPRARLRRAAAGSRGEVPRRGGADGLRRRGTQAAADDRRAARLPRAREGARAMAAVTFATARAVREESRRLRRANSELRFAVRANNRVHLARLEKATAAAEARNLKLLALPAPSPWSDLAWRRDDEELGRALVPLD